MKRFVRYFLQGLLYLAPLGVTLYIIYILFTFVDGLLSEYLRNWLKISIPGLGVVVIISVLTLVGYIGQTIIAEPFKLLFKRVMEKAPIIKVIYSSLNDLFSAFVGKEKKFTQPVLVRVNLISDLEKMGFMTQEDLTDLDLKNKVAVYFPHSYNFSGELFIVPREHVRTIDIPPSEAMKFIVSGGVSKSWEQ